MKRAANIMFLVGGIVSIVNAVVLGILATVFYVFSGAAFTAIIIQGIENGTIQSSFTGTSAEVALLIQTMFLIIAIIYTSIAGFAIANSIISFKSINSDRKGLFIANIVFAFLGGVEVNAVAGIFGLIKGDTIE